MKNVKSISSLQWSLVEQRRCLAESFPYGTLECLIFLVLYGRFQHGQVLFSLPLLCAISIKT